MPAVTTATADDAEEIQRVARLLRLEGRELTSAVQGGFFLYVGTVAEYRATLAASPWCLMAREDGQCVGFVTTMTPEAIAKLPAGPNRNLFDEGGEFPLLIEQIGVVPEWQNRGVGQALLEALLEASPASRLMATVVHAPVRNQRSIGFLLRNGWRLQREVTTQKRVWGFYEFRR